MLYARRRRRKFDSKTVRLCGKFGAQLHEISIASGNRCAAICEISRGMSTVSKSMARNNWFGRILTREFRARRFACARARDALHNSAQVGNSACKLYPTGIARRANMLAARETRDLIELIVKKGEGFTIVTDCVTLRMRWPHALI